MKDIWIALSSLPDDVVLESGDVGCDSGEDVISRFMYSHREGMCRNFADISLALSGVERIFKQCHSKKENLELVNRLNRRLGARNKNVAPSINHYIKKIHTSSSSPLLLGERDEDIGEYEESLRNFTSEISLLDAHLWERLHEAREMTSLNARDEEFNNFYNVTLSEGSFDLENIAAEAFLTLNTNPDEYSECCREQMKQTMKEVDENDERYNF